MSEKEKYYKELVDIKDDYHGMRERYEESHKKLEEVTQIKEETEKRLKNAEKTIKEKEVEIKTVFIIILHSLIIAIIIAFSIFFITCYYN